MIWVVLAAAICYGLAVLPIVYAVLRVHGPNDLGKLWGFAPNQFLFLTTIFPFAAFYSFLALRTLVVGVRVTLPLSDPARLNLDHWPAGILAGLTLVSLVALIVYSVSAMSLDKLRPPFAQMALDSIDEFETKLLGYSEEQRDAKRRELIEAAGRLASQLEAPDSSPIDTHMTSWLQQREPEVALQFLVRRHFQLRLGLLEPTLHALNVFQILVSLFVGAMTLWTAALTIYAAKATGYPGTDNPHIRDAITLLAASLFLFALYPILYHQLRVQLEDFVGSGFSVLQDIFTAAVILGVLWWLNTLDPSDRFLSLASVFKFLPIVVVSGGFALAGLSPAIVRQVIGRDTNWGIQLIIVLLFIPLALLPWIQILVRHQRP